MVSDRTTDTIQISAFWKTSHCTNGVVVVVLVPFGIRDEVLNCGSTGKEVCLACFVWVTPSSPEQMWSNGCFECKSQQEHLSSCLPWNLLNYLDLSESIQIKNTKKVSKRVIAILASSLAFWGMLLAGCV